MCLLSVSRPACTLRATWTMVLSCSAVSMKSLGLLASSATQQSSSPTLLSNDANTFICLLCRTTWHHVHFCWVKFFSSILRLDLPRLSTRALDSIAERESTAVAGYVEEVLQTLNDLIEFFKQPDSELEHEEKQCLLRSLIKRQDLFKDEVRAECEALNFLYKYNNSMLIGKLPFVDNLTPW